MHQIGVVGLSYRHAGVADVARFAVPKEQIPERLPGLRAALNVAELCYVGTCNRVEVLYTTADGSPAGDARREVFRALIGHDPLGGEASRMLRAWTGEAAVEHLFLVACGLDSAQAGEKEIAIQIRGAWATARAVGASGPVLDRLLGEALSMASRVRRLEADVRTPSLADLASDRVLKHLAATAAVQSGTNAPVALIGVSPMTRRCAVQLRGAGMSLLVVNRSFQPAEELAAVVGGRAMSLDEFRSQPPALGAVILAAGGGEPILAAPALAGIAHAAQGGTPLLIDFGVPPNAEPSVARAVGLTRVGMDELIDAAQERRLAQLMRLAPVRAAIDERLTRLRGELATRAFGRKLADLRDTFEQIAAEELARSLATELRELDDNQRQSLERFASTVARRLAHLPLAGLRAAAAHASSDAVDAFFREARLTRIVPANDPDNRQNK
jgi:glutamyl-tRNA reductase